MPEMEAELSDPLFCSLMPLFSALFGYLYLACLSFWIEKAIIVLPLLP